MKYVIRTDASLMIGSGHVMRCLTLAHELRRRGEECLFICRELPGNLADLIRREKFELVLLPNDTAFESGSTDDLYSRWLATTMQAEIEQVSSALAERGRFDGLIVDHYALGEQWESSMRPLVGQLLAIDDIANRKHDCDILLDQNLYLDRDIRYQGLASNETVQLIGPEYALLRAEFSKARQNMPERDGRLSRALMFFGGSDPTNETGKALEAMEQVGESITHVDVIVGGSNPKLAELKAGCEDDPKFEFHQDVTNMAELMTRADIGLGAAGSSTWERCCLGLPSLLISIADNQIPIGESCNQAGFGIYVGCSEEVTAAELVRQIVSLQKEPEVVRAMSKVGMELVNGKGAVAVAERLTASVQAKVRV